MTQRAASSGAGLQTRRAIASVSLSGTLTAKLDAIAAAGFDGVEIFDADLAASRLRPAQVAARCAELGLTIEIYQPIRDVEGTEPSRFPDVIARLARDLDVASELGARRALICSNVQPTAIADADLCAAQLRVAGELAASRGLSITYEALSWGQHVSRLESAWQMVQRVGHPAVGLAVDTFHVLARGDTPDAVAPIPPGTISHLQIADAPRMQLDMLTWSRQYRCFPGQGMLDVAGLVKAVLDAGYTGPLSLEVFSSTARRASPDDVALEAIRSLHVLEADLSRRRAARP